MAKARREFAGLLRAAEKSPQAIYRRGKVAAMVVSPDAYTPKPPPVARDWGSMREMLAEFRKVAREENYTLPVTDRMKWSPEFIKLQRGRSRRH